MRPSLITCPAGTSLGDAAALFTRHAIHAIVVADAAGLAIGVLSDIDLLASQELSHLLPDEPAARIPAAHEEADVVMADLFADSGIDLAGHSAALPKIKPAPSDSDSAIDLSADIFEEHVPAHAMRPEDSSIDLSSDAIHIEAMAPADFAGESVINLGADAIIEEGSTCQPTPLSTSRRRPTAPSIWGRSPASTCTPSRPWNARPAEPPSSRVSRAST